jgi:excisionase family DNA binding protein
MTENRHDIPTNELPGLWNKTQAAAYLGIATSTLNHWICDRKIIFIKMGSLVRFRKADLDRFITKNVRGR